MHTQKRFQCRHIFTDGHRCGSPVLLLETPNPAQPEQTHEDFCYYHHTTRRPAPRVLALARPGDGPAQTAFALPLPEDRSAIQAAIGSVLAHIAANTLDPRRAGLLLYGLQIAALNLPPRDRYLDRYEEIPESVTAIVTHPTHGPIAEPAEIVPPPEYKSLGRQLMEEFGPLPDEPDEFDAQSQPNQSQPNHHPQPSPESILPSIQAVAASEPSPSPRRSKHRPSRRETHPNTPPVSPTRCGPIASVCGEFDTFAKELASNGGVRSQPSRSAAILEPWRIGYSGQPSESKGSSVAA